MRVIFLDIDGVLNKIGRTVSTSTEARYCCHAGFDVELVDNFAKILRANPDVKVVLSTAWRDLGTTDAFELAFATWGISVNIISKTPHLPYELSHGIHRGLEISNWLEQAKSLEHVIEQYVVIDDGKDAGFGHEKHFVHTNYRHGLVMDKVEQANRILKGELNAKERHATQPDTSLDWATPQTNKLPKA